MEIYQIETICGTQTLPTNGLFTTLEKAKEKGPDTYFPKHPKLVWKYNKDWDYTYSETIEIDGDRVWFRITRRAVL